MPDSPNFCQCGCGTELPPHLRFCRGHQLRRNSPVRRERKPAGISKADAKRLEAEREKLIDARERIDGIPFKTISGNEIVRRDLRHKAQTDLYFLATEILGIPLVERVHKPLCDFLVQKDPDVPLADWSQLKKRLYMLPRNSFKSTVAVADVIQVILCDPNVRILIMRGTLRLAQQMLSEVKQHFVGNQKLRLLFPEFCGENPKALGGRDELVCPARSIVRREPTISIGTVESSKVGLHADWLLLDDLVDDLNSRTPDGRDKVLGAFQMLTPIAEPWAYTTVVGTPYHVSDLYATVRAYAEANPQEWGVMVRSAWTVQPGADENSTNPDDFDLWFPERLSFEMLQKVKAENEAAGLGHLFTNQYLCRPTSDSEKPQFDIATLQRHTIPAVDVPPGATHIQFWDLAFSTKRISADYSVGLCAAVSDGRVYIVDSVRDHFQPTALASRIVEFAARWNPQRVGIENANGSQFLMPAITSIAQRCRVPVQIEWVNPPRGKDAKQSRIYSADSWLGTDRLWISASLPHLQVLYDELTQAGNTAHDDMADTLGYLLAWCGQPTQARVRYIGFEADQPAQIEAPFEPNNVLGYGLVG